jgi:hypothetical protein
MSDQTPEPPPNPFRILSIEPRLERKRKAPKIIDTAGPDTPLKPYQAQPMIEVPVEDRPEQSKRILMNALLNEFGTKEDAAEFAATLKLLCMNGNPVALKLVAEYILGKPVSRSESGKPGEFSKMDELVESVDADDLQNIIDAAERFKKDGA